MPVSEQQRGLRAFPGPSSREPPEQTPSCSCATHQIPSQAMTMKSWSSFIVSTLMSGKAEIICSSGGRFLLRL